MAHEVVRSRSRIITTIAAALAVVALTGAQSSCEAQRNQYSSSKAKQSNSQVEDSNSNSNVNVNVSVVEYSVTSDARIETITFLDEDGDMVTKSNVGRSWSGTGPAGHGTVMISATTGDGSSMIKCSVRVHGEVVQRASAVGGGDTTVVCKTSY
jgi:hypothetical protein